MSTEEKNIQNQQEVEDKLLIDHDYDGIKELNNKPPPWLMLTFYASIIWSVFYVFHYHVLHTGPSQEEEYKIEMAEAASLQSSIETNTAAVELITDEAKLAKGLSLWTANSCGACHGALGEGNAVGPNLTDKYWLHGGSVAEVYKSINEGIPNKGMTPFKGKIADEDLRILSSYILTKMVGSNPANAKDPQGELYE